MTLGLAVVRNGDEMSTVNVVGMCICLSGIIMHSAQKATSADPGEGGTRKRPLIRKAEGKQDRTIQMNISECFEAQIIGCRMSWELVMGWDVLLST